MNKNLIFATLLSLLTLAPIACTHDETDMGLNLQDPTTLYNGICDTISANDISAYTIFDTNLLTSSYYTAIVGHYNDDVYGDVSSQIFSQIAISGNSGIDFTPYHIDSVILSLVITERYPIATTSQNIHLKINQLAEAFSKDSNFHSTDSIPISSTCFLDTTLAIAPTDTMIELSLNNDFIAAITAKSFSSQDDFISTIKGICFQIVASESDRAMFTFDFAKEKSGITVHYTLNDASNTYKLLLGYVSTTSPSTHFCHFYHRYSGDLLRLQQGLIDSIEGSNKLYLEPMGGTAVKFNIDGYIKAFHQNHPRAVIHYAELLLPLDVNADAYPPEKIIAYRSYESGLNIFINDFLTNYNGYDGTYHADEKYYRLRITQHMQELLNQGADYGTTLYIDGRRSSARRTILKGTGTDNPIKIAFIYTE